jgi:hypothetical protein
MIRCPSVVWAVAGGKPGSLSRPGCEGPPAIVDIEKISKKYNSDIIKVSTVGVGSVLSAGPFAPAPSLRGVITLPRACDSLEW